MTTTFAAAQLIARFGAFAIYRRGCLYELRNTRTNQRWSYGCWRALLQDIGAQDYQLQRRPA